MGRVWKNALLICVALSYLHISNVREPYSLAVSPSILVAQPWCRDF